MSRVILCSGKRADVPFVMKASGRKVYTVEELCYCLRDELETLDGDTLGRELADFLGRELGLTERAQTLRKLVDEGSELKSRLVVVLCASDLYTAPEINEICEDFEKNLNMTPLLRAKKIADRNLLEGRSKVALSGYRDILSDERITELSDSDLSAVLHNCGVIQMRLGYPEEAASLFLRAYAHSDEQETVRSYLLALKLLGDEERYIKEAMRLFDSGEILKDLEDEIGTVLERFEEGGNLDCVERLKGLLEDNSPAEFDRMSHEIVGELKASYRADIESME
ncbi:MAG: hypothetical protein IJL07_03270 [Lachnospiraceae bacterium]|nr:hypothetical protein [Lachnospiraceae bacterium]